MAFFLAEADAFLLAFIILVQLQVWGLGCIEAIEDCSFFIFIVFGLISIVYLFSFLCNISKGTFSQKKIQYFILFFNNRNIE